MSGEKQNIEQNLAEEFKRSNSLREKENATQSYIPQDDEEYNVTLKTWYVVMILALSYGISFWIVPSLSSIQTTVATQLGYPTAAAFYISIYTMTVTIAFIVCGANSDLFSRR